ncbi:MAG: APC family permease, partial [Bacteroidota bacterium]
SDGLTSSCYGPEEIFRALGKYPSLSLFISFGVVFTILIISTSYSQIIKLFPSGGGGYKVATKLLSPRMGMISGSSLLVDYVLTISMSISAGTDAMFSLLPVSFQPFKMMVSIGGIMLLILLNLRGIKESVFALMPVFFLFVITHAFLILYTFLHHAPEVPMVFHNAVQDFHGATKALGLFGAIALMLKAYSMGAGTFTGIEAVSNSIPILKEPRVKTGLITMRYMAISLAVTVFGLLFAYVLFNLKFEEGKTLNAILLQSLTSTWNHSLGVGYVFITLLSEAALLFVAAQTGFLDGPRVISSMAQDSWFPRRFTVLSDRLVTQNGILFMGLLAIIIIFMTGGSVQILVVLYSINVFITFALSQTGMVKHWWVERKSERHWQAKIAVNGIGLIITLFILFSVVTVKFTEGGWVTILITSTLILVVSSIKKHYLYAEKLIHRLDAKMFNLVDHDFLQEPASMTTPVDTRLPVKTAVICVNGFNGLGLCTLNKVMEEFHEYRNIVFLEVGIVDSANFRGNEELEKLQDRIALDLEKYKNYAEHKGYLTASYSRIGTDVADEIKEMAKEIDKTYPGCVFFVGQFLLPKATAFQRTLHNQTQFAIQNRLSHKGFILVMIPIRSHIHL